MPDVVVRFCIALLASVFAWSAAAKVVRFGEWRRAVAGYKLGSLENAAVAAVPLVEALTVGALLLAPPRPAAAGVTFLLAVFSLAVLRARALQGSKLPCGCFGKTKERDFRVVLVRNGTLALVAAVILLFGGGVEIFELDAPSSADLVPVLLSLLGVVIVALAAVSVSRSLRRGRS